MFTFHGGCVGCIQQDIHGTDFCYDCCYFESDWDKEDLSLTPVDLASAERERVKLRRENK